MLQFSISHNHILSLICSFILSCSSSIIKELLGSRDCKYHCKRSECRYWVDWSDFRDELQARYSKEISIHRSFELLEKILWDKSQPSVLGIDDSVIWEVCINSFSQRIPLSDEKPGLRGIV